MSTTFPSCPPPSSLSPFVVAAWLSSGALCFQQIAIALELRPAMVTWRSETSEKRSRGERAQTGRERAQAGRKRGIVVEEEVKKDLEFIASVVQSGDWMRSGSSVGDPFCRKTDLPQSSQISSSPFNIPRARRVVLLVTCLP